METPFGRGSSWQSVVNRINCFPSIRRRCRTGKGPSQSNCSTTSCRTRSVRLKSTPNSKTKQQEEEININSRGSKQKRPTMEVVYMQIAMVLILIVKCLHGSLSATLQGKFSFLCTSLSWWRAIFEKKVKLAFFCFKFDQ